MLTVTLKLSVDLHTPLEYTSVAMAFSRRERTYLFHTWPKCMVPKAEGKNFPQESNVKQGPPSPKGKHQKLTSFGSLAVVALESMTLTEDSDLWPLAHPIAEPCTSPSCGVSVKPALALTTSQSHACSTLPGRCQCQLLQLLPPNEPVAHLGSN